MSKEDDGWITAEELMNKLEKDPSFLARRAARQEKFRKLREKYDAIEKPILDKLRSIGFDIDSTDDLVNKHVTLPSKVVAVLLDEISTCQEPRVCEMLVKGLIGTEEPFNGRYLTDAYDKTNDEGLRWAILNCIACTYPFNIEHWLKIAQPNAYIRKTLKSLGYPITP